MDIIFLIMIFNFEIIHLNFFIINLMIILEKEYRALNFDDFSMIQNEFF